MLLEAFFLLTLVDVDPCVETVRDYERFFAACDGCVFEPFVELQFDAVIDHCAPVPKHPAEQYAKSGDPYDASFAEVLGLVRDVRRIDVREAADVLAAAFEAGTAAPPELYNGLRARELAVLERVDPSADEVRGLIWRVGLADRRAARPLEAAFLGARADDPQVLKDLRGRAIALLTRRAIKEELDEQVCHADPSADPGFLTVGSKPWGSAVYVNGTWIGETPVSREKIASGCVSVRVVDRQGREKLGSLEIRPNKVHVVSFDLDRP